ncbi:type VI secretion system accessory protein TagJ [Burkholderia ubonensis]|uniref:ImpE protein superfamily protein n=1 Tax=Burkholderia ubonensis TaxID=101571 RepID=A0AAW3MQE3_9BURK|nr:type VI secretion system accessory protein TagJ [Burkholderia ubonensis]KVK99019.1 ImpE protein superfamily protein [Burkholderia ubonensis]KVN74671.1 ImpE protein superfamily protein [Burkholderia ubonensis]KVO39587.1 ImpE protein superfamily protein [Burkholderia ubonensis]KVP89315.1 ImpE protein superfamily protein [Burkholderia ubonensis]KVQ54215.1 ImpE protein superfamily protein [Burkholderia ubonensis]
MTNRTDSLSVSIAHDETLANALHTQSFAELKARTTEAVRNRPTDARERWLLYQWLCIDGEWERALKQLQTWARLDPDGEARAQLHRGLIRSEMFRSEVFAGRREPGFIDVPPAWVGSLLRANAKLGDGAVADADALRREAFEEASSTAGDSPEMGRYAWLTDSDTRLGPIFEMAVAGGYCWIPFEQIRSIALTPAGSLTDLAWRPTTVILRDATVLKGYVPTRYPGSESGSANIRLARETTWTDVGTTHVIALGQRTWTTDLGDWGLLEIANCRFTDEDGDAAF